MNRAALTALGLGLIVALSGCGDDEKKTSCEKFCDNLAAADCLEGETVETCVSYCDVIYGSPVCNAEARALVDCWASAAITCNPETGPTPACDDEEATFFACVE